MSTSSQPGIGQAKPRLPVRVKVIQALIRSSGMVVNVRTIVKNIRDKATEIVKGIAVMSTDLKLVTSNIQPKISNT